jgi:uncharacterized NAD(P)/FAD-binding protein YdhS
MSRSSLSVAIVGGGPTSVALLDSIVHFRNTNFPGSALRVTVFDPCPHPWSGSSFGPDRPEALTNLYSAGMSVRDGHPEHAEDWLSANGYGDFLGTNFAPRSVIGRYFKEAAWNAALELQKFSLVREKVTGLAPEGDQVVLKTRDGSDVFDYAVLAVGRSAKFDPYGLEGQEGACIRPYPLKEALANVTPHERIGIIGCGLTAVDLTMALKPDNHQGPITLLSRRGLLPAPRPSSCQYELSNELQI